MGRGTESFPPYCVKEVLCDSRTVPRGLSVKRDLWGGRTFTTKERHTVLGQDRDRTSTILTTTPFVCV